MHSFGFLEPGQYVEHMVGAHAAGLQRQLHGHQYVIEPVQGDGHEHLGHHAITTWVTQQMSLKMLQGLGHGFERSAIAQGAGLALQQADVVAPVVQGLTTLEAARQDDGLFRPSALGPTTTKRSG